MTSDDQVLLPHPLRDSAVDALTEAFDRRLPTVDVLTPSTPAETLEALASASILVTMGFEDSWYDHLGAVEWVQVTAAGVNHIDIDRLVEADIIVTNASGVHAEPIAQQVLGYMLVFERNLHRAMRQQERGVWERFRGGELGGKTVGIIGVGAIGAEVARLCATLDMTVLGTKRDTDEAVPHVDQLYPPARTDEVLAAADYLVLACPLTDDTRGLIDAAALRTMPSRAVLINIARGPVVDEAALVEALQQRRIRGAALDVFEEEPLPADSRLWDLSNAVITPHMAGSTPHYWSRCAELVASNYERFASGSSDSMANRIA